MQAQHLSSCCSADSTESSMWTEIEVNTADHFCDEIYNTIPTIIGEDAEYYYYGLDDDNNEKNGSNQLLLEQQQQEICCSPSSRWHEEAFWMSFRGAVRSFSDDNNNNNNNRNCHSRSSSAESQQLVDLWSLNVVEEKEVEEETGSPVANVASDTSHKKEQPVPVSTFEEVEEDRDTAAAVSATSLLLENLPSINNSSHQDQEETHQSDEGLPLNEIEVVSTSFKKGEGDGEDDDDVDGLPLLPSVNVPTINNNNNNKQDTSVHTSPTVDSSSTTESSFDDDTSSSMSQYYVDPTSPSRMSTLSSSSSSSFNNSFDCACINSASLACAYADTCKRIEQAKAENDNNRDEFLLRRLVVLQRLQGQLLFRTRIT